MTEWITWNGGECPIPDAKAGEYEAKTRDGKVFSARTASFWEWRHINTGIGSGSISDIIAYRLIEEEQSDLDWLEEKVRAEFDYQSDKYQSYVRVATREAFRKVLDLIKERKEAKS